MEASPPTPPQGAYGGRTSFVLGRGMQITSPQRNSYKVIDYLGHGVYGQVYKVVNTATNVEYALKIGFWVPGIREQLQKEVRVFNHIDHFCSEDDKKYLGHMIEYFQDPNYLVIITDLYMQNVYRFLKSRDFDGMPLYHVQSLVRGLVSGLRALHDQGIIHSDLKPENVMLTDKSEVKIIDFGASCFDSTDEIPIYCQSRHYRAPEVILQLPKGPEMDIWSLGCIAAEFFFGLPPFAGVSELNMIQLMEMRMGNFPIEMIESSPQSSEFFFNYVAKKNGPVEDQCHFRYPSIEDCVLNQSPFPGFEAQDEYAKRLFIDFLQNVLSLDPETRYTIDQVENHAFLQNSFV